MKILFHLLNWFMKFKPLWDESFSLFIWFFCFLEGHFFSFSCNCSGESLSSISKLYGVPLSDIAAANEEMVGMGLVFEGQQLNIPSSITSRMQKKVGDYKYIYIYIYDYLSVLCSVYYLIIECLVNCWGLGCIFWGGLTLILVDNL